MSETNYKNILSRHNVRFLLSVKCQIKINKNFNKENLIKHEYYFLSNIKKLTVYTKRFSIN